MPTSKCRWRTPLRSMSLVALTTVAACTSLPASSPITRGGAELGPAKGILAKHRSFVEAEKIAKVRQVWFAPVVFGPDAASSPEALATVANAAARAVCIEIEDRFEIVDAPGPDVLEIRLQLTQVRENNTAAAAAAMLLPVRAPIGLGSLTAEAEAVFAGQDKPVAAMIWARRADPVFTGARPSKIGDAYELAQEFGGGFGELLAKAANTRKRSESNEEPCHRFGRPRVGAIALEMLGVSLPPSVKDDPPVERSKHPR